MSDYMSEYDEFEQDGRCPQCGGYNTTCLCFEPEDTEPDVPLGDKCPHCESTLTDDVATIWQDDDLICLAHQCFWCGRTFETVKPRVVESAPGESDGIPF